MNAIEKLLSSCDRMIGVMLRVISVVCLVTLLLLLSGNVFFRFIPVFSMGWFDEIVEMAFAWMIFIGAAELWRVNEHFQVDILLKRWKKYKVGYILVLAIDLLSLAFFVIFFYYSYRLMLMATDTTPIFKLSKRLLYVCMPIASAIMGFYTIRNIIRHGKEWQEILRDRRGRPKISYHIFKEGKL